MSDQEKSDVPESGIDTLAQAKQTCIIRGIGWAAACLVQLGTKPTFEDGVRWAEQIVRSDGNETIADYLLKAAGIRS